MIKANELRVGNWVKIRGQYEVQVINNLCKDYFSYMEGQACYYTDTEPIPLTPEILITCGFAKDKLGWYTEGHARTTLYQFRDNLIQMAWKENVIGIDIHSLHQLQNLYFALTGEELIYTPSSIKTT